MRVPPIALLAAALAGLTLGCGGAVSGLSSGTDAGASDGADHHDASPLPFDGDVPDSFVGDSSSPWSPVCPTAAPAAGTACSQENLQCEYGSAWWSVACDTVMQCQASAPGGAGGQWSVYKPSYEPCTPQPGANPPSCPADFGSVPQGSSCSTNGVACYYAQGLCQCQVPLGGPIEIDGGTGYWGCVPEQGCPFPRARLGTACTSEGAFCTYEECSYGQTCSKGIWQATLEACAQAGGGPGGP